MNPAFGIHSLGVVFGEQEISPAELAVVHGAREEDVRAALAGTVVVATSKSRVALAHDAAARCLERAGLDAKQVDLLVSCRSRVTREHEPPLPLRLGRPDLPTLEISGPCTALFQGITVAQAWLRAERLRRALIVYAETCEHAHRVVGAFRGTEARDVLSDAAAAVLVGEDAAVALVGHGFAFDVSQWAYAIHLSGEASDVLAPSPELGKLGLKVAHDSIELSRLALQRCLDSAGLSLSQIDAIVLPNEVDLARRFLVRHLALPKERILSAPGAATHAWAVDAMHTLDWLLTEGHRPSGSRILVASRALGASAFLAIELQGRAQLSRENAP